MPRMMRAMAPRPPTTPPTMGPMGGEEPPLSGCGEGVMKMVVAVEEGGFCRELEVGAEVVSGVLDELDVELMKGVYQIWPVPAATAQPSRL